MPPAPRGAAISYGPRRVPGMRVKRVDYTGGAAVRSGWVLINGQVFRNPGSAPPTQGGAPEDSPTLDDQGRTIPSGCEPRVGMPGGGQSIGIFTSVKLPGVAALTAATTRAACGSRAGHC